MSDAFKYYDQGWNARLDNEPFNKNATRDWRDGYNDADEAVQEVGIEELERC